MNSVGRVGEEVACEFLKRRKFHIVERNFRTRNGEIDIIAIDKSVKPQTLVFVEVKTRTGDFFGTPFEAITPFKLRFLVRTAQVYRSSHPQLPECLRIDAVSVQMKTNGEEESIEHVKNISQ